MTHIEHHPTTDHPLVWIDPCADIGTAAQQMVAHEVSSILVGSPGELVSILTERDLARSVAEGWPADTPVTSLAVPAPYTVDTRESLEAAGRRMLLHGVRHLVVTRSGRAVGVISMRDVLHALLQPADAALVVAMVHSGGGRPEHWWG